MAGFTNKLKRLQQQAQMEEQKEQPMSAQEEKPGRQKAQAVKPPKPVQQTGTSGKRGRNFMLSPDVYELLDLIHWRTKKSLSEIVDASIREFAKNHEISS